MRPCPPPATGKQSASAQIQSQPDQEKPTISSGLSSIRPVVGESRGNQVVGKQDSSPIWHLRKQPALLRQPGTSVLPRSFPVFCFRTLPKYTLQHSEAILFPTKDPQTDWALPYTSTLPATEPHWLPSIPKFFFPVVLFLYSNCTISQGNSLDLCHISAHKSRGTTAHRGQKKNVPQTQQGMDLTSSQ